MDDDETPGSEDQLESSYLSSFLQNTLKTNQVEINTDSKTLKPIAKLREPRDLFSLPKELDCPQQAARWPAECQVSDERIQHIDYLPPLPELYYQPTGREIQPKPVGDESGTIVFQYYPMSAVNYFSRSSVGGSRYFLPSCNTEREDDLRFESRFESGNLAKAVRITETYYELYLRTDLYTNRHMQWFYFRIENTRKSRIYRISIVNLSKAESLYSVGMRPLFYSTKDAVLNKIGWRRCGENITYFRNDDKNGDEENGSFTLTFNLEFPHDCDIVYLAHCYPYTYTDLQDYLIKLQNHPIKSSYSKLRLLCRSLAGNNVYYLTVTSPSPIDEPKRKQAVVITGRVHPGETPSSWMMKGFMDFLTGDSSQARELREKFIFKLVPMLNPDGVIVGNNRCSLTGRDLNRQYRTVIRETYPPVWHTKLMIRRLMEECGIAMYCDLHGHSRKHNVFIYGCENKRYADKKLQEQVFPLMLHKNAADKFSFESCKFRIQRSKEGTGRVVIWMMGVANSYTMEASFGGSTLGTRNQTHFTTQDYEAMGRAFCETLLDFCDENPAKERLRMKIITRLVKEGSNADEPTNIILSDYSSTEGDTSSSDENEGHDHEYYSGLMVPPPSPVTPQSQKPSHKEVSESPKLLRPIIIPTPPTQRKILQVICSTKLI
ncbi:nna1 carboxypeptidase [Lycorma delicatula]|uniref:nna1 carboxypeptidase n=1 Tax=Lycorma delicatula TaxID=130591 RepID=UPI003F5188F5